jgi:hypothetical protein
VAFGREDLGDRVPHQARTDDGYVLRSCQGISLVRGLFNPCAVFSGIDGE